MPDSPSAERRHFQRIPMERQAYLKLNGDSHVCDLVDISLKGALLTPQTEWQASNGDKVHVDITLDDLGDAVIHMNGEIAHIEGRHIGIACHQLDLDSATLLRRVVELNLADPDLLERELQAMLDND